MAERRASLMDPRIENCSSGSTPSSRWSRCRRCGPARSTTTTTSSARASARSCRRRSRRCRASRCRSRIEEIEVGKIESSASLPTEEELAEIAAAEADGRRGRRRAEPGRRRRPERRVALTGVCAARASSSACRGGIAAYKAVEVCRRLVDAGVHVVAGAHRGRRSGSSARSRSRRSRPSRRARRCSTGPSRSRTPASARPPTSSSSRPPPPSCIGKYAAGISDDLLTATLLATRAPVLVCPAMHTEMWEHPAVQENLATLRAPRRARASSPRRAASPAATSAPAASPIPSASSPRPRRVLGRRPATSPGVRVLVTAGGTREPIDPVRFIGNRSSGKMGYAIAAGRGPARRRASCSSPPSAGPAPPASRSCAVETAERDAATRCSPRADAADVDRDGRRGRRLPAQGRRDQQAEEARRHARDRARADRSTSSPTSGATSAPGQVLVGFAAETDDLRRATRPRSSRAKRARPDRRQRRRAARRRLRGRHQPGGPARRRRRASSELPLLTKAALADVILDRVAALGCGAAADRTIHDARRGACVEQATRSRRSRSPRATPTRCADQISDTRARRRSSTEDPYEPGRVRDARAPPGCVVVAGEISTKAHIDIPRLARDTIRSIGYTDARVRHRRQDLRRHHLDRRAVARHRDGRRQGDGAARRHRRPLRRGRRRRPGHDVRLRVRRDRRPHADADLARAPAGRAGSPQVRKDGIVDFLRPDGKTQVIDRVRGRRARSGSTPC